ncbi:MAG: hypothetical protein YK1309IOTA_680008 [Marine Group I thaumarchaeote]|nr:MAG: hypothetical protein YK1309IOTA_680008 [Marine Group I thaumarchaeote]
MIRTVNFQQIFVITLVMARFRRELEGITFYWRVKMQSTRNKI